LQKSRNFILNARNVYRIIFKHSFKKLTSNPLNLPGFSLSRKHCLADVFKLPSVYNFSMFTSGTIPSGALTNHLHSRNSDRLVSTKSEIFTWMSVPFWVIWPPQPIVDHESQKWFLGLFEWLLNVKMCRGISVVF
jgi:hypothetical protein